MAQRTALQFDEDFSVSIVGTNLILTKPIKDYVLKKVYKLEKLSHHKVDLKVRMTVQKLDQRVDLIFTFSHTKVAVHAITEDLYASIDKAFDRLVHKLKKWKGKLQEHHARGVSAIDMQVDVLQKAEDADLEAFNDAIEEETLQDMEQSLALPSVEPKSLHLLTLTLNEAIMKMELSSDPFLVYRSQEDKKLKIIYRRKSGHYGLLSPEEAS